MTTPIAERVSIQRRYLRSVDISRDLDDPEALDGYILTPSARDAAIRIAESLQPDSRQRAFRLVGAYGSGKSAFGLFLARLLQERGHGPATRLLADASPQPPSVSHWQPIVLVGRRVSFAHELVRGVAAATTELRIPRPLFARAQALLEPSTAPDPLDVTALLADVASNLRARTGAGLLLIVDEMGRFLEHAAAHPTAEDPSLFQSLAERSGGRSGADLAVVGILHHGFADYVAGLGAWIEAEWSRLSARYEEIRFDNSTEQSLFMLARALVHTPIPSDVRECAEQAFRQAMDRGLYAAESQEVVAIAPYLYPLHPSAIATIAAASRRFGQNERSLFSFLHSLEPHGFLRFIRTTPYGAGNWYRTSEVFDHLAATVAETPTGARQRRWSLALDAVTAASDVSPRHLDVLKTVALLSVLEPVPGLLADPETLGWCLQRSVVQVSSLLDDLHGRRLIYWRTHRQDYGLWSNTSIDLARWLDRAQANVPRPQRLQDAASVPRAGRPIIAHRHYHATGTLRTFDVRLWSDELSDATPADGRILVVPVYTDRDRQDALDALGDAFMDPLTIICFRRVPSSALNWAHELALWDWVRNNCEELRIDELARTEVSERIAAAEASLRGFLSLLASPAAAHPDAWWTCGRQIDVDPPALSAVASAICDQVFNQAPVLRNELLNRAKLTSAAATARMRLLDAMLSNAAQDRLGIQGTPPELAMYLSLFRNSGIHRPVSDGAFAFQPPSDSRWRAVWQHIGNRLAQGEAVRIDSLIEELGEPPLGVRAGPSLPLIAAYVLAARDHVAVLERDTFLPDLTTPHFMRLAKAPRNFSLRSLREPADHSGLLAALANGLSVLGPRQPTVPAIAAGLFHWFNRLTPYAMQTDDVSPMAVAVRDQLSRHSDPGELFFRHLPDICLPSNPSARGMPPDPESVVVVLDGALTELDLAIHQLRRRAIDTIVHAFEGADLDSLRRTIRRDFAPHSHYLRDHRLAVFVERAGRLDVSDDLWLDGVAGHVLGKRPANWADATIDELDLEVRIIAGNLAKWLSLAQTAQGSGAGLRSVHVVDIDGRDRMVVLRQRSPERSLAPRIDAVRAALGDDPDIPEILGRMLEEYIDRRNQRPDGDSHP